MRKTSFDDLNRKYAKQQEVIDKLLENQAKQDTSNNAIIKREIDSFQNDSDKDLKAKNEKISNQETTISSLLTQIDKLMMENMKIKQ